MLASILYTSPYSEANNSIYDRHGLRGRGHTSLTGPSRPLQVTEPFSDGSTSTNECYHAVAERTSKADLVAETQRWGQRRANPGICFTVPDCVRSSNAGCCIHL